ncbi:MAG: T9SS type A sorting domain-containing protein, partial [Bacteroidales bacterium]|nr:T9SS type A sorting domain-containing protein [Bacteroidales bacterium]
LHTTIHPDSIVDLIITQQQSHPSVYYFELPVPVKFSNNTKDTLLFFDNTYDGQVYSFKLNFIPNTTTFDPEYELIAKIDNNIVNIEENNLSAHNIYPNPFKNIINIENNNNQFDRIEIYNIESKKVFEKTFKEAVNKTQIDLKHLKQGVYFLKIISTDNIFIQHIVKL